MATATMFRNLASLAVSRVLAAKPAPVARQISTVAPVLKYAPPATAVAAPVLAKPATPQWADLFGRLSPEGYDVAASLRTGDLVKLPAKPNALTVTAAPASLAATSKPSILEIELGINPGGASSVAELADQASGGKLSTAGILLAAAVLFLVLWVAIPLVMAAIRAPTGPE